MEPDEPFVTDVKDWPTKEQRHIIDCHEKINALQEKLDAAEKDKARLLKQVGDVINLNLTRTNERNDLQSHLTAAETARNNAVALLGESAQGAKILQLMGQVATMKEEAKRIDVVHRLSQSHQMTAIQSLTEERDELKAAILDLAVNGWQTPSQTKAIRAENEQLKAALQKWFDATALSESCAAFDELKATFEALTPPAPPAQGATK